MQFYKKCMPFNHRYTIQTTQTVQTHTEKEYYTFISTLTETTLTFSTSFSGMLLQTENNVKYNLQVAILLDHEKEPYSNYVYIVQMLWTKIDTHIQT